MQKDKGINAFIDQLIALTNVGYKNSKIPLNLHLHCAHESSITESTDKEVMLARFEDHYGDAAGARMSADTAVLLVSKLSAVCGGVSELST